MDDKFEKLLLSCGMAILPWLTIGIAIAISLNSSYIFPHDVLSALGSKGSATEYISPAINNYPVGFLFFSLRLVLGCHCECGIHRLGENQEY